MLLHGLHLLHGLYCIYCMDTEWNTTEEFDADKREAHARTMLQKMTAHDNEKQRLWRWALRGVVIQ